MEEEPPDPDLQKPRYLLPEGCSDLNDVIRRQEKAVQDQALPAAKLPTQITIPEPIRVADLATRLQVKSYKVIVALMGLKIFVTQDAWLNYPTAAAVGASLGVSVLKAGPSGPGN